jgi:hypothetical protein
VGTGQRLGRLAVGVEDKGDFEPMARAEPSVELRRAPGKFVHEGRRDALRVCVGEAKDGHAEIPVALNRCEQIARAGGRTRRAVVSERWYSTDRRARAAGSIRVALGRASSWPYEAIVARTKKPPRLREGFFIVRTLTCRAYCRGCYRPDPYSH